MIKINQSTTHFGYQKVQTEEKANLVGKVFRSVASHYDLMNDFMSLGLHRHWKRFAIDHIAVRPGNRVLDVATGTGDLAKVYAKQVGKQGKVMMTDINDAMLHLGRNRLIDAGFLDNVYYVQADAEQLPFADNYFDCVSIGFGLRNVTRPSLALQSMFRVLKPGGRLCILEFSRPPSTLLHQWYDWYSFHIIPKMGEMIAKDKESYQYLVESIRMHPDQETLKAMMIESGFEDAAYHNLTGGIVALHTGYKY